MDKIIKFLDKVNHVLDYMIVVTAVTTIFLWLVKKIFL